MFIKSTRHSIFNITEFPIVYLFADNFVQTKDDCFYVSIFLALLYFFYVLKVRNINLLYNLKLKKCFELYNLKIILEI